MLIFHKDVRLLRGFACTAVGLFFLSASLPASAGQPYQPEDLDTVVFTLSADANAFTPEKPLDDASSRLAAAEQSIRHFQQSGNPRDLSAAGRILDAISEPLPPRGTIIRAYIAQARHDFGAARQLLEKLVREHPAEPHAWMILADIYRVSGELEKAEHACRQRLALSPDPVGVTCLATVFGLTGREEKADALLTRLAASLPPEHAMHAWITGTRAELYARHGKEERAATLYRLALQTPDPSLYLVAEYVDLLMHNTQYAQALEVLAEHPSNSALLVRKALALQRLERREWRGVDRTLGELFALESRRGDAIHLRERAAWLLYVRDEPDLALQVALQNFEMQKEPEDIELLIAAANAAGKPDAANPARQFLERYRPQALPASQQSGRGRT